MWRQRRALHDQMEWTSPVAPLMTVALERTTKRFGRSSTTQEPPSLRELVNHLGIPTQSSRRVRFGLVARAPAPLCPPASPSAGLEGLYVAGATQESSLSRREAVAQESQMKFRVYTFRSAVCKPTSNCIGPSLKPSDMYRSCWQAVGPFAKQQQVCKVPCNKQAMPLRD